METPDVVPRPGTPALVHESYDFIPGSGEDPTWDWVNMPTMQQFVDEEKQGPPRGDSVVKEGSIGNTIAPLVDIVNSVISMNSVVAPSTGNTGKDHNPRSVWYRGTAGNTATSPVVLNGGDTGNTVVSPIVLLSDVVQQDSPATSTPGSTPSPGARDRLSEISIIDSSVKEDGDKDKDDDDNDDDDDEITVLEVVNSENPTLDGNSVMERLQEASDSAWSAVLDDSDEEMGPRSCVAHRTRSHTGNRS